MGHPARIACLALSCVIPLLSGCASSAEPEPGDRFVDVVGTPFLVAFKVPVCAASLVIAAPLAGLAALAGPSPNIAEPDPQRALGDGLASNCGPPYIVAR